MKPTLSSRPFLKLGALFSFLPAGLLAHPGHDGGHGLEWDFAGGFSHPLFGFDHVLAMVAVGVWAAQAGGRVRWLAPAVFVSVLALGAAFGTQTGAFAAVEPMIAASLLAFGLMIAMAGRLPVSVGLGGTALFAAFHGFAHGAELPASSHGFSYALGFAAATLLLHAAGLALGTAATRHSTWLAKAAGAGIAAVGGVLLLT